jgi:hypothetical protein
MVSSFLNSEHGSHVTRWELIYDSLLLSYIKIQLQTPFVLIYSLLIMLIHFDLDFHFQLSWLFTTIIDVSHTKKKKKIIQRICKTPILYWEDKD